MTGFRLRWSPLLAPLLAATAVGLLSSACTRRIGGGACEDDGDCISEEACHPDTNVCVPVDELGRTCTTDIDCDINAGEVCLEGLCKAGEGQPDGPGCSVTADCPMDQFCNSATLQCQPLLTGWCRDASQCDASAPVCSATSPSAPGRCVECLSDADCGGGTCEQPGVCTGGGSVDPGPGPSPDPGPGPSPSPECPANATASGDRCVCDPGFVDDGFGGCVADSGGGTDTDSCAELGYYGDGICDSFCPSPDPDCTSGGGGGGGTGTGTGACSVPDDCWATNIDHTCEGGQCVCDVEWMTAFRCASGETVDPASCTCTAGGGGGGTTTGVAENGSCVDASGNTLACATGLECIYSSDANGDPLYGSCKKVCTADSQCGTGRQCALGFLSGGDGICGRPLVNGQNGCTFWEQGDTFCFDPTAPSGANDAFLECLNSTCGFVCDYEGNTGAPFTCPANAGQCGQPQPMTGFNVDIAKCGG